VFVKKADLLKTWRCLLLETLKPDYSGRTIKNIFGLKKVRYKGLAKNTAQLYTLFALANLLITRRRRDMLCTTGAP
jgi:IS5 family transposase